MKYSRDVDSYITKRALELSAAGGKSETEIAEIITQETGVVISRSVVHGRVYRNKLSSGLEDKPRPRMPYFNKYENYFTGEATPKPKLSLDFSEGPLKILVLNDLHTPFQYDAAIERALMENRSADVVVTSEVSDMYSLTPFAKYQHVSFEQEVEEIIRWFEYLSENFPCTYVIPSGHDRRLPRYILNKISSELLFLVETNLLEVLARPFHNIIVVDNYWVQINDAIFTHLDKHSAAIPMRGAHAAHLWLQSWKSHFDIKPYRVLIQAHTHHSGMVNLPDVQLVETGCLQRVPEWVLYKTPNLPWTHGWCVIYQYGGKTNVNKTEVITFPGL